MTGHARGGRMTHEERVRHHMYETCEGIAEQSERIASLEELVLDMWHELAVACAEQVTSHETLREVSDRMRELGVAE